MGPWSRKCPGKGKKDRRQCNCGNPICHGTVGTPIFSANIPLYGVREQWRRSRSKKEFLDKRSSKEIDELDSIACHAGRWANEPGFHEFRPSLSPRRFE